METEQDKEDRRRLTVKITEKGLILINDKQAKAKEYFNLFIDSVGEENARELISIINLAVSEMDNIEGEKI